MRLQIEGDRLILINGTCDHLGETTWCMSGRGGGRKYETTTSLGWCVCTICSDSQGVEDVNVNPARPQVTHRILMGLSDHIGDSDNFFLTQF